MFDLTSEENSKRTALLPMVPLRNMVVFPRMIVPFIVGRKESLKAVEYSFEMNSRLFFVTQKDPEIVSPGIDDLFDVGTVSVVVQSVNTGRNSLKLLIEGEQRAKLKKVVNRFGFPEAELEFMSCSNGTEAEKSGLAMALTEGFKIYAGIHSAISAEIATDALEDCNLDELTDTVASHLIIDVFRKQMLLSNANPVERALNLKHILRQETGKLEIDEKIGKSIKEQIETAQKEYYLGEKIKAIRKELGKRDSTADIEELKQKIKDACMPDEAEKKAVKELERLEAMPPVSAEATVSRTYIDWLLDMPWKTESEETSDIESALKVLDEDHFGLKKAKERILEYLAVSQLVGRVRSSILCFSGPPGVGKTSLAKSVARATGRKYVRLSLGGIRDEAEIRGHRRTYIGAFPGQIVQKIKGVGTMNPVFLLDEMDKIDSGVRGDPASALLEVLDPEQNHSFLDHYLDVEFDLSRVMFIGTANNVEAIPPALRDRMEVIELSGYTSLEKIKIAGQFLIPKQKENNGLKNSQTVFSDSTIAGIIDGYTRESGVRNLEREIGSICRKVARKIVAEKNETLSVNIEPSDLHDYLGLPKYLPVKKEEQGQIGLASGLAVTSSGGELLLVEAMFMPGEGKLNLTGNLGEVMRESAQAGLSYVRANCERFSVDKGFHKNYDVHLHVPQGAVPKDGPSAGVTITTAFLSALKKLPVNNDFAMTGEVTLRGKILKVGGIKEKILAAHRAGLKNIILPYENKMDREDIPEEVLAEINLHFVNEMHEVFELVFRNGMN